MDSLALTVGEISNQVHAMFIIYFNQKVVFLCHFNWGGGGGGQVIHLICGLGICIFSPLNFIIKGKQCQLIYDLSSYGIIVIYEYCSLHNMTGQGAFGAKAEIKFLLGRHPSK